MLKKGLVVLFLFLPLLIGCQGMLAHIKPPLEDEGEVVLYLQPFSQESDKVRFRIEGASARRSDGVEFPFSLKLSELKGKEMTRQRLLGSAVLPAGTYTSFSIKIKDAYLGVEDGDAALLVPPAPVRVEFFLNVSRKKAYIVTLLFNAVESLKSGFSFNPVFSVSLPHKPITSLTGFVTNYGSNNITVFDKKTGQAAALIATDGGPAGMAVDQRNRRVYVAIPDRDIVGVVDIAAGDITDMVRMSAGDRPKELALTPDGRVLLTVNTGSNTVSLIDTPSLIESSRINVGNGPCSIMVDPSGRRAYAFNNLSSTISVIDIANRALVTTISTDPGPLRGQFNRLGDRFYVIHEWSAYLSVMDAGTLSLVRRMSVGMGMRSIKVDANTDLVYLGKENDVVVGIYEPFSFVLTDYVQVGGSSNYLTIDGDENNLITVTRDLQRLVIINLISRKVLSAIDVGEAPYWVTLMGEK